MTDLLSSQFLHLVLLRHGYSEWQAGLTRDRDSALTSIGHQQAPYLARRMRSMLDTDQNARLISSPMRRALETVIGIDPHPCTDARLAEAEFHVASQLRPQRGPLDPALNGVAFADYAAFRSGVYAVLAGYSEQKRGGTLVLMTHGGVIKTMLRIISGTEGIDFKIGNCSLSEARWDGKRWQIQRTNDQSHLPASLIT
jgi:probable phosphoglycerate mutase